MKKKLFALFLAATVCASAVPSTAANAKTTTTTIIEDSETDSGDDDTMDSSIEDISEPDDDPGNVFTKFDLAVYPAKKTIRIGQSFTISIVASDESEWADLDDPEWEELCSEGIDSISFRSSKSSVASVNKSTGKVKGKKKGSAVIKTTIDLANGESITLKTKVYVTR